MTLRSNFLSNRINYSQNTSFHQVFYLGFIRCEGKCFSTQQMVMLWKILFFMILFYFILWCYYTHDAMVDYVYEVIRYNEPLVSWQMEQPILIFISYVNMTDVTSLGQMSLALIIYCCYYGSWCYYETMWVSGVTRSWCCGLLFE